MRLSIALKVAIGAGLLALTLASTATAAIPGYRVVEGEIPTPNISPPTHFLGAACRPSEISLGAGARVNYGSPGIGPFGLIVMNRLVPGVFDADQDGVTVRAFEKEGGRRSTGGSGPCGLRGALSR